MQQSLVTLGDITVPSGATLDVDDTAHGRLVHLRAGTDLHGFSTGRFAKPAAFVRLALHEPSDRTRLLGLAFTQFALPVVAGADLAFDFAPAANLSSPPALGLLLVTDGERTTLLAPVDGLHEQIVSVANGDLRWGWHGDLDDAPAGTMSTLGVYDGTSTADVLDAWVADLRRVHGPAPRRDRAANPFTSHLSYWTDNGAAYWYRTEPDRTITASVRDTVRDLRDRGVPVMGVELDSWFYRHETPRPIAAIGYPEEVPPSGAMEWLPRADAFDTTIDDWADGLGRPPLALHARHISPRSPYLADGEWWVDDLAAHPVDPSFFRRWFDDAVTWGATVIEQDWMLMYWFGVRALRAAPGRARDWQRALDRHALDTGVGLMFCMATPADFVHAATLPSIVAVRTSDDYRFAADPALLWLWFLTVNRVAGVLDLPAFKDVFFSRVTEPGDDVIDGDPHAEVEALLSALSGGPVGIGDRLGRTDRAVVLRTCDADGRLRHVDRAAALVDGCLFGAPARGERLAWATATATRPEGTWTYVVALDASMPATTVTDRLPLAEIGITGTRSVLDWRTGAVTDTDALEATLADRGWGYWVIAPPGRRADEGDLTKYVTNPSTLP